MPLMQMIRSLKVFRSPGALTRLGFLYVLYIPIYAPSNQAQPDEILVTKSSSHSRHEWDIIYAGDFRSENVCMMDFEISL